MSVRGNYRVVEYVSRNADSTPISYEERARVTLGGMAVSGKTNELTPTEARLQTLETRTMIHSDSLSRLWKSHEMVRDQIAQAIEFDEEGDETTPSFDRAYDRIHGTASIGVKSKSVEDNLRRDASRPWFVTYSLQEQTDQTFAKSVNGIETNFPAKGGMRIEIRLVGLYKKVNRIRYGKWLAGELQEMLGVGDGGNETWNPLYVNDVYVCGDASKSFYEIVMVSKIVPDAGNKTYIKLADYDGVISSLTSTQLGQVFDLTHLTKNTKKTNEFVATRDVSKSSPSRAWYKFSRANEEAIQDGTLAERLAQAVRNMKDRS